MTDKQIIINGVDVSECTYSKIGKYNKYCEQDLYDDGTPVFTCDECTNCYYKQLKRKEQECEELKKELHQIFKEKDGLHLIIDRLLEASGYDTNTASAEDFEDVYENMRYEKQQLDQYKQALAEIKEIAEENIRIADLEGLNGVYRRGLAEQILQKISEVENDNK